MATKLKNLKIRKVDFVDEGANPEAHIKLIKRKGKEAPPAEENSGKESRNILKKLLGFIGKAAGMEQREIDSVVEEIQKGDSISFNEKINEVNNRKIMDEMWDVCYALQSALCSILNDEELDSTKIQTAMKESLEEFHTLMEESIQKWAAGKEAGIVRKENNPKERITKEELEVMKSERDRLTESINRAANTDIGRINKAAAEQAETAEQKTINGTPKGEEEMKIDKSKMTPAELAFFESIEKRYGTEGAGNQETVLEGTAIPAETEMPAAILTGTGISETPLAKATGTASAAVKTPEETSAPDDIYKGLHPAVRAELEGLKKFKEAAEDKELSEIAKKYAIIGKKEEELVPLFKSLKAVGGTAYNDMIAVLDQTVTAVEKSGLFSEIGKSGNGTTNGGAWAEAEAKAVELMKSKAGLSKVQALDEVFMENPELAARCEKEG